MHKMWILLEYQFDRSSEPTRVRTLDVVLAECSVRKAPAGAAAASAKTAEKLLDPLGLFLRCADAPLQRPCRLKACTPRDL